MIIGTAGHIDHGKTALVHALTGVDTDRLPEEKARGISIELGYAYAPLPNGEVLGFIDVPGHERLVHTMLAGACGIDYALLVIAADDGVMPQTREHLEILGLLGINRGALVLTKIDRVEAARVREVETEARALLSDSTLRDTQLFTVNARDAHDGGVRALREHLQAVAQRTPPRPADGLFRLAVDRVFTLPGHGTVATGTVFSGQVSVGDTLHVMPAEQAVRVRGIHAQRRAAAHGQAGERCALNIAGVDKRSLSRGDWLADPRALSASLRLDVRLEMLATGGAGLRAWSPVHVHLGTAHRLAHAVPLESPELGARAAGRVQLVFDAPFCAAPGDRFILRDAQGRHTIGGGQVLDPSAPARRRRSRERHAWLGGIESMLAGAGLTALLECAPYGAKLSDLVRLCGREQPPLPECARLIQAGTEPVVILIRKWEELRCGVLEALRRFHANTPDEAGPDTPRLRRMSFPEMPPALWRCLLGVLLEEGAVCANGPWLRLPAHRSQLSAEDERLVRRLQPLIAAGGFDPPWVRDLAAAVGEPEARVRRLLRRQLAEGGLYQVVPDLFYDPGRVAELARIVQACSRTGAGVGSAQFRDAVGLGRKRAIQILEFFDRVGFTRRVRDTRVVRAESAWHGPAAAQEANAVEAGARR